LCLVVNEVQRFSFRVTKSYLYTSSSIPLTRDQLITKLSPTRGQIERGASGGNVLYLCSENVK
jgi:hypothetical protein